MRVETIAVLAISRQVARSKRRRWLVRRPRRLLLPSMVEDLLVLLVVVDAELHRRRGVDDLVDEESGVEVQVDFGESEQLAEGDEVPGVSAVAGAGAVLGVDRHPRALQVVGDDDEERGPVVGGSPGLCSLLGCHLPAVDRVEDARVDDAGGVPRCAVQGRQGEPCYCCLRLLSGREAVDGRGVEDSLRSRPISLDDRFCARVSDPLGGDVAALLFGVDVVPEVAIGSPLLFSAQVRALPRRSHQEAESGDDRRSWPRPTTWSSHRRHAGPSTS